jgi:hypothetical protein
MMARSDVVLEIRVRAATESMSAMALVASVDKMPRGGRPTIYFSCVNLY